MTKLGNKALRDHAIPFVSNFVEFSTSLYGDNALQSPEFMTEPYRTAAIPMTRPEKGDLVEAYLFMELTAPASHSLGIKIGIGTFTTVAGELCVIPETVYTNDYINEMHKRITGSEDSLTVAANGTLFVDADLSRAIDHRGDSTFLSDAFCLLVTFDRVPSSSDGYSLDKFKLNCTAQMGYGT